MGRIGFYHGDKINVDLGGSLCYDVFFFSSLFSLYRCR